MRKLIVVVGLAFALLGGLGSRPAAADDAEVRYVITNGGDDVGGKAQVDYFPAGKHEGSVVTWSGSGGTVRVPAGTYNVRLTFNDGAAHKEQWLDNQSFAGKVEKTVEVGVPITEVRYVITNGGADVEGKGEVTYFPAGKHDGASITWAHSGGTRMPEGTYNVHVTFGDGAAHKEMWFDNQVFAGTVEKTVEVGVAMTEVRYVITNGGADVEGKGEVTYFPAGKHDGASITWAHSGGKERMPEGTYNVHVTFGDGAAHKEMWFDNQVFAGTVEKTVEVGVAMTEVRYVITNGGADVEGKGEVTYFPAGKHDGASITWAHSGGKERMPEGTYNVHVTFGDGAAHREKWLDNQTFSGKVDRTVEIGLSVAEVRYLITNGGTDIEDKGEVAYFPIGKHDGPNIVWARSGGSVRLPEGSYNVHVTFADGLARKDIWLHDEAFSDKVEKTVELGLTLAEPTVIVTQNGADAGDQADVTYFNPIGQHEIGTVRNGEQTVIVAGTYDIRARLAAAEGWLRAAAVSGKPELTIEVQEPKTQLKVTAVRDGRALTAAWCGVYPPGETSSDPQDRANSGEWQEVPSAAYDVGCFLETNGNTESGWLKDQTLAPGKIELTVVMPSAPAAPTTLSLAAPAATPEQIGPDKGDFPYLMPLPGSTPAGGKASTGPVYVQLPDAHQPDLVATSSIIKWYRAPGGVSVPTLLALYRDALLKAGWTIVAELHRADALITTHYGQSSRNIWAFIHMDNNGYSITVADATIVLSKLVADLGSNCHLALTGVLFDFDKSTLKPESDAVLEQVSAIMAKDATLRLEVQGHTDGVGSDAYNQPLSEARARSVVVWLTQHEVVADRLSAHGYGKTKPIAPNNTDEGRARNRRVEIANLACKAKS